MQPSESTKLLSVSVRACDLVKVFLFCSTLNLSITPSSLSFLQIMHKMKYHRTMRLSVIRMTVKGKVSDDGRGPDTAMGCFSLSHTVNNGN